MKKDKLTKVITGVLVVVLILGLLTPVLTIFV